MKAKRGFWKRIGTIHEHWGNGGGAMAARFGQFAEDGNGFLLAWSSKGTTLRVHELMVSKLTTMGTGIIQAPGFPKKLTSDGKDKRDVTVVAYPGGFLVAYIDTEGSKFVKLDHEANMVGVPEAINTARLEGNAGGLTKRAGGENVWITGITKQSFRLARLGGGGATPSPPPPPPPRPLPRPSPRPSPPPSPPPRPSPRPSPPPS